MDEPVEVKQALLPCPFCGGPGALLRTAVDESQHIVGCANCTCCIGLQLADEAVAAWNTRSTLRPATDADGLVERIPNLRVENHREQKNPYPGLTENAAWSEVVCDRPGNRQIAHCADESDAQMILAALDAQVASLQPTEGMLNDLLAVIHRDGGHRQDEVGREQAWSEAMAIVPPLLDSGQEERALIVAWLGKNADDFKHDPLPEYEYRRQFEAGRAHEANIIRDAISRGDHLTSQGQG